MRFSFDFRFYYWSEMRNAPLSVTVTPCMSTIRWTVHFKEKNDTPTGKSFFLKFNILIYCGCISFLSFFV